MSGLLSVGDLLGVGERDLDIHALLSAIDGENHSVACVMRVEGIGQILRGGDLLTITFHDQIASEHDLGAAFVG